MFTIAQAGDAYKILDTDGSVYTTLVLPTGVTVDSTKRSQFHSIGGKLVITGAPSLNLWVNPLDFSVRPLGVLPPPSPPTIAAGASTGLTGAYYAAYSYIVAIDGLVVQESPLSPISSQVVLADDDINWTNLVPSTEAHVTGYRLYRTVAGGDPSVMFLAQEVGNQSVTSYTGDNVLDAALDLLPSPLVGNAPGGTTPGTRLQCCIEWNNRLWGVADDDALRHYVYYTEVGSPFAWLATNRLPIPIGGEDEFGVIGFLRRRDMLVAGKRRRFCAITGGGAGDFEVATLAEGPGMVARDSAVVIDDIGYCLGLGDVWSVGPEGVKSESRDKVNTWYQTDLQYNIRAFPLAMGGYNPITETYDLHAQFAGDGPVDVGLGAWSSLLTGSKEWTGAHTTLAHTTCARGTRFDANGQLQPVQGGTDGYIYDMNREEAYDASGAAPSTPVGIPIHWISKLYAGGDPDLFCVFGQPTLHQRAQGSGAGYFQVYAYCGPYDDRIMFGIPVPNRWAIDVPLSLNRVKLPRVGHGQVAMLVFRHNTELDANGATAGYLDETADVELWGIEFPFAPVGRR